MKKGLSLLLAFAMVFSVFASVAFAEEQEQELTPEQMFEELKEKGIFSGIEQPDGTVIPGLDQQMNRAQFAEVLTNLFALERDADAANFKDLTGYGWAKEAIGAAKNAGIMVGDPDGKFRPGDEVKFEELASVLVEAFDLEVDENAAVDGKVSGWAKGYVAAAVAAGLLPKVDDYTAFAIRADLVTVTYAANKKVEKDGNPFEKETGELKIVSAGAVGVKTVEVKFNKAVDDSKAKFTVKRGSSEVTIDSVTWSEDKKTATLNLVSKMQETDYTVAVSGLTDEPLTAEFSVSAEKVAKIEFLGDVAPLDRDTDRVVYVRFAIYNQYGEDITDDMETDGDIRYSIGNGDQLGSPEDGILAIVKDAGDPDDDYDIGDIVTVSITDKETGTYANANLKVSDYSKVASVDILGLVNRADKDDKPETTNDPSDWYLLIKAYDQYGFEFDTDDYRDVGDDISVSTSDDDVLDLDEDFIDEVTIDGEDYIGLQAQKMEDVGTVTVRIVAQATGKVSTYEVAVSDPSRVVDFRMTAPADAVAGEEVEIPFTALDADGNEIKDYDDLTDPENWEELPSVSGVDSDMVNNTNNVTVKFKRNGDGTARLVLDLRDYKRVADSDDWDNDEISIEAETDSGKSVELNVVVKEHAKPSSVAGVSSAFVRNMLTGTYTYLDVEDDIIVYDQYDRPMKMVNYLTQAVPSSSTAKAKYQVQVTSSNPSYVAVGLNEGAAGASVTTGNIDDKVRLQGLDDGSSTIEIKIFEWNGTAFVENDDIDSYKFTSRSVEQDDIKSYELKTINAGKPMYDFGAGNAPAGATANTYKADVRVVGKLSGGAEVAIGTASYNVDTSEGAVKGVVLPESARNGSQDKDLYEVYFTNVIDPSDDEDEKTVTVVASVYDDDDIITLTQSVVVSDKAPKADVIQLHLPGTQKQFYSIENATTLKAEAAHLATVADAQAFVGEVARIFDQYNGEHRANAFAPTVLITNVVQANGTKVTNPTWSNIQGLTDGATFKVQISSNGKVLTFDVEVVNDVN